LIADLHFCRQLKQTARICHIERKYGFGDYTAGFFGKLRATMTSCGRRLFHLQRYIPKNNPHKFA